MRLKRFIAALISAILCLGVLFTSGCSEEEVNALVDVASYVIEEYDAVNADKETQTETESQTEKQTEKQTKETETESQAETEMAAEETTAAPSSDQQLMEDGEYLSMEDVSLYLHLYGHLPDNFLTKSEAKKQGWVPSKGNLWDVAPGAAIGGDRFGNREKLLPTKKGRKYYECDVNYNGGERGAERIVYSNDGLIYYTDNHYEDFMMLFDGTE